eukprot:COSAG02_NODE_68980_length_209_cov_18.409091_1_plen_29_part_10
MADGGDVGREGVSGALAASWIPYPCLCLW